MMERHCSLGAQENSKRAKNIEDNTYQCTIGKFLSQEELHSENYTILSEYFEYIQSDVISYKREACEVNDIKEAVTEMVHRVVEKLGSIDRRFVISDVKLVGSMAEGTKNGEPDEFDFLLVVENISMSRNIKMTQECEKQAGHVHIALKEDASVEFTSAWKDTIKNGKLMATGYASKYSGFSVLFHALLTKAVKMLARIAKVRVTKKSGELLIYRSVVDRHGPACTCLFIWNPKHRRYSRDLIISVDLTAAIKFANKTSLLQQDDISYDEYSRKLQISETFMAVGSSKSECWNGYCFRLTFTETELQIMAELSYQHKKCYRILKYLFNGVKANSITNIFFNSYAVKTFLLKHNHHCVRKVEGAKSLAECVIDVLADIHSCFHKVQTVPTTDMQVLQLQLQLRNPSIFMHSHNVYGQVCGKFMYFASYAALHELIQSLKALTEFQFDYSTETRIEQFLNFKLNIVMEKLLEK